MRKKTIWIINHYAGNTDVGLEYRHYHIAKELKKQGLNVVIFASSYTHLLNDEIVFDSEYQEVKYQDIPYVWIKTPKYEGNGLSRFKNMFVFTMKLQKLYKKIDSLPKPDYVLASAPHPFVVLNGYFIGKHFNAKFIFEERDLWPMSILELTEIKQSHPIIKILQFLEDFAYKRADLIISPLVNITEHIKERGIKYKDFMFLPNAILLEDINSILSEEIEIDTSIFKHKLTIGFAGTVGPSNCVFTLIESAKMAKDANLDIGFVIVGNGQEYEKISKFIQENNLDNVFLVGRKSKKETMHILKECDVLYNAAPKSDLYKYGLSAIKVPEYMYLAKYIINAVDIKNDLIELSNSGSTIEPENAKVLFDEIEKIYTKDKKELNEYGKRGKNYVLENLTYDSLVVKMKNKLNSLEENE